MSRATGALMVILGAWLLIASLAGRLVERILSLVAGTPGGFGEPPTGEFGAEDGNRLGPPNPDILPDHEQIRPGVG